MTAPGVLPRLAALTLKETRQMLRDRSNLIVGLLLPVTLIGLFGYGLSFDLSQARLALVLQDSTQRTQDLVAGLDGSPYISPTRIPSMAEAEALMAAGKTDAILRVPAEFSQQLAAGAGRMQLVVNGGDTNTAGAVERYVAGAITLAAQKQVERGGAGPAGPGGVTLVQRNWFNEAGNSTWFLVPGLIALILTLIGAFLTSLLIAREWERGTLESLFVTPVRPLELVLSKLAPYLVIGAIDLALCLLAARFLFHVPMRGALGAILGVSMLYLLVSLALGLLISALTRNQFAASQVALLTSFLPALMLSGFVFDLRNVPVAVQAISQILPVTHFMGLIKTLFLAGNNWPEFLRVCAILSAYALVAIALTQRLLRKRLR